jgi:GxxExxY protein
MITKEEYHDMYLIVGAAMDVYNEIGRGLSEYIYQEAMRMELEDKGILAEKEKVLNLYYKGRKMGKFYVADFYYNGIIVETKSASSLCSEHRSQLFNYMRISHTRRGLLINFGEKSLRAERYLYQPDEDDFVLLTQKNYKDYISNL